MEIPGPGIKSEPHLWPTPQLWQCWLLTHCAGPGIELVESQRQAGALTQSATAGIPQLLTFFFLVENLLVEEHFALGAGGSSEGMGQEWRDGSRDRRDAEFTWQASCRFASSPPLRVSPAHSILLVMVLLNKCFEVQRLDGYSRTWASFSRSE